MTLCLVDLCAIYLMLPKNLTDLSVHMSYTHLKMIRKQHFKGNKHKIFYVPVQGGSNMTGTGAACLHTNQSRSYLNHLVHVCALHYKK